MPRIEAQNLTKVFYPTRAFGAWLQAPWRRGQPVTALDRVTLAVEPGEMLCVMGPNGAGKTTLLKILAGLLLPNEGLVRINDHAPSSRWLRSQMGFASGERAGFYDRLTGWQNLKFFAALQGWHGGLGEQRIREVLEQLEISDPHRPYQAYSTGVKQRLNLARALLHHPAILLLDEPTKSLDITRAEGVTAWLADWVNRHGDKTVIFTTHDVGEAVRVAHRIVVLYQGSLRFVGSPVELQRRGDVQATVRQLYRA